LNGFLRWSVQAKFARLVSAGMNLVAANMEHWSLRPVSRRELAKTSISRALRRRSEF